MARKPKLSEAEAQAMDALRALGGFFCTNCGKELDRQKKQFVCPSCQQVHCPFCEQSVSARCPHRLAHNIGNRWHFRGVITPTTQVPRAPLAADLLLNFTPAQKKAAFGDAAGLVKNLYGTGLASTPQIQGFVQALADHVAGDARFWGGSKRWGTYYFARDVPQAREQARRILRDIEAGFSHLRTCRSPSAPYLLRALAPPDADKEPSDATGTDADTVFDEDADYPFGSGRASLLSFAPDGRQLATNQRGEVWIWDLTDDAPAHRLRLESDEVVRSLTFAPDGGRLVVHSEPRDNWSQLSGSVYVFDVASGQMLARQKWPQFGSKEASTGSVVGFLHGGATLLLTRSQTAHLIPVSELSATPATGSAGLAGGLKLEHRLPILQTAIAPDGERFATRQGNWVLLWRVSREDVRGPGKGRRGAGKGKQVSAASATSATEAGH